jgi:hypothetical protein
MYKKFIRGLFLSTTHREGGRWFSCPYGQRYSEAQREDHGTPEVPVAQCSALLRSIFKRENDHDQISPYSDDVSFDGLPNGLVQSIVDVAKPRWSGGAQGRLVCTRSRRAHGYSGIIGKQLRGSCCALEKEMYSSVTQRVVTHGVCKCGQRDPKIRYIWVPVQHPCLGPRTRLPFRQIETSN